MGWALPVWARYEDLHVALDEEPVVSAFGPFATLQAFLVFAVMLSVLIGPGKHAPLKERLTAAAVGLVLCVGLVYALWYTLAAMAIWAVVSIVRQ